MPLLDKVLERLDRNKSWKWYGHISRLINLLKAVGIWPKVAMGGGAVMAIFVVYLASVPIWARLLIGIATAALYICCSGGVCTVDRAQGARL